MFLLKALKLSEQRMLQVQEVLADQFADLHINTHTYTHTYTYIYTTSSFDGGKNDHYLSKKKLNITKIKLIHIVFF